MRDTIQTVFKNVFYLLRKNTPIARFI